MQNRIRRLLSYPASAKTKWTGWFESSPASWSPDLEAYFAALGNHPFLLGRMPLSSIDYRPKTRCRSRVAVFRDCPPSTEQFDRRHLASFPIRSEEHTS